MTQTNLDFLAQTDSVVAGMIASELNRQRVHLELIASENFTSPAVMAAQVLSSRISTPKVFPISVITVAANLSIK